MASAGALGRLSVILGLDSTEFTRGLNRSEYQAKKTLDNFERQAKRAATAFVAIGAVAATGFAVMTKRAIDSMDSMSKMAQQAGTTTEILSALTYAADLSGVSQEKLVQSLARLSQSMADAAAGTGEAKDAFAALGVSVTNSDGSLRSSDSVFTQVAQRLSEMENGSRKTALAMDIFGRSGAQLIPLLNSGADGLEAMRQEAERLGVVMDSESARAAEQFNDSLTKLGKAFDGLFIQIAEEILPELNAFVDRLNSPETQQSFADFSGWIVEAIGDVVDFVEQLAEGIRYSDGFFDALGKYGLTNPWKSSREQLDRVRESLRQLNEEAQDPVLLAQAGGVEQLERARRSLMQQEQYWMRRLQRDLASSGALRADVPMLGTNTVRPDTLADPGKSSKAQKPTDPLGDFMRDINIDYAMKEYQQYLNFIEDITGRADQKLIEQQQKWLDSALETGRITVDEYGKAMDELVERTRKGTSEMDQFAIQAARNIESHIGDTMYQVFKGNFDNIGASFSDMLARMAADLASSQLSRLLLGNFGSTGSVGGLIGNIFGGLFGGGRASGGPVDRGMFYEVNENGPELLSTGGKNYLMMGNQSGYVTPRVPASPQVSGGNSNITTNVYISDSGTRTETSGAERQGRQLAQMIEAQVRSVVANERRQGGVLWNMANGRG